MRVVVDVHESPSGIPTLLENLGFDVCLDTLAVADYRPSANSLVERKSAGDLVQTLRQGRFWTQMGRLRTFAQWPYLLIEGESDFHRTNAFRGIFLAIADLGITVITSADQEDSAAWLARIAIRRAGAPTRDRPPYAQRRKQREPLAAEAMLASVPGISVVTARALLAHFGSIRAIVSASSAELECVPGVGAKRASAILATVADRPNHSSCARMVRLST